MVEWPGWLRRLNKRKQPPHPNSYEDVFQPLAPHAERMAEWRSTIRNRRQRAIFDRVAATVDVERHRALQEKYREGVEAEGTLGRFKYLDMGAWFRLHSFIARVLDLDRREPCSVLDVGAGGGQFLAIAKALGHDPHGLDLDRNAVYGDLLELFGVSRTIGGVYLGKRLPEEIGRYDAIVIHAQVFDVRRDMSRWELPEWAGFLEYLTANHLNFPGDLFIGLNKSWGETGTEDYYWPLVELAEKHGARILTDNARFLFRLDAPLSFPEIDSVDWPATRQDVPETAHRAR